MTYKLEPHCKLGLFSDGESGVGKAAKKNKKRLQGKKSGLDNVGKTPDDNEFTPERLLPLLKDELDKAKADKVLCFASFN